MCRREPRFGCCFGEIRLGKRRNTGKPQPSIFSGFSEYREAKRLASEIGKRDNLHEDVIFSDTMHMAVPPSKEVRDILLSSPARISGAVRFRPLEPIEGRELG